MFLLKYIFIDNPCCSSFLIEQNGLIYSFACNDCAGVYIEQTGQKLKNRIKQHISDRNTKTLKVNCTAAYQHSKTLNHTFDFVNTRILTKENNLRKRLTVEAITYIYIELKQLTYVYDIDNFKSYILPTFRTRTSRLRRLAAAISPPGQN